MSEEDVRRREIPYAYGIARLRKTSRGQMVGLHTGMMKTIFSLKTRRLLGCHIVGEGATQPIHIGRAMLNLRGTVDFSIENTFSYPTLAEAYEIAGPTPGTGWGGGEECPSRRRTARLSPPGRARVASTATT